MTAIASYSGHSVSSRGGSFGHAGVVLSLLASQHPRVMEAAAGLQPALRVRLGVASPDFSPRSGLPVAGGAVIGRRQLSLVGGYGPRQSGVHHNGGKRSSPTQE